MQEELRHAYVLRDEQGLLEILIQARIHDSAELVDVRATPESVPYGH
jgi:hypothetical protein